MNAVYIYWRDDEPLYVGTTSSVERRMKSHEGRRWVALTTHVTVWEFDSKADARAVEVDTIQRLRPRFNYTHNSAHLTPFMATCRRRAATVLGHRIRAGAS